MSHFTKFLVVVAAISMGALVSQKLSGQNTDESDAPDAKAAAGPPQKTHSQPRLRASDAPVHHAIVKKEDETAEEKIAAALDKPTNVEFLDLELEAALKYLSEYHGINVWLDKQSLTDEGVALDQPITLKLAGARLESILNLLLQPLQLDWVIQDEVLKITTSNWAYDHPETQTYDVANLIEAGHAPDELIAAITKCVEPGTWTGTDATAGIAHTGGVLVVRHTQRAHIEVARLIADLDEIAASEDEDRHAKRKNAVVSVRVYRTGDQPAETMAEALQDFVAGTSWEKRGGEGEVQALKGALVVKQTADVHRSIHRFLAQFGPKASPVQEASETPPAPAATAQSLPDPFGVLNSARHPAAGAPPADKADRPKSPMKKNRRNTTSLAIPTFPTY